MMMADVTGATRGRIQMFTAMLAFGFACSAAPAAVTLLGVQYQQDELFPEFNCIWHDKNYPTSCSGTYLGGNLHVYLKNTGGSAVSITDVTLAGYSLTTILPVNTTAHNANSVYFYWDEPPQDIIAAGIPVWFKGDPSTIAAGGVGQAVIRLRFPPTTPTVSVGVVTTGGTINTTIPIDANAPQLASVGFSQDRTKVYLHWRRSGGAAPATVWMDGVNVTANTTTVGDASVNFAASVLTLTTPLPYLSYHVFQGVYADGKTATASLRAWSHPFLYASWSVFQVPDGDLVAGKEWIDDAINRGFNAVQNQIGGGVGSYLSTINGRAYAESRGYGIITWNKNYSNPLLTFINDEVDAEEDNVADNFCGTGKKLPCGASPMGILGMRCIGVGEDFRNTYPLAPTTTNMNGTFKPENYYAYGQLVDVLQVDPYYQKRLKDTYWYHNPEWIPLYNKATYNYAVAKASTRAAEPNPFHVILQSCESREDVNGVTKTWPFPTPEAKRIEVYYSLAGGAKGISYWWFKPGYPSNGLGDQSKPAAQALWKEMGMFGNEIKTASSLLVTSHPVDLAITPGANVWAKALASGTDTLIFLVVNDNYYNDESGCHYTPVGNATLSAALPSWMQASPTAFEIAAAGISDVAAPVNAGQLQLSLGTLNLTRMIVVTTNPQLKATIQQRYEDQVRPGICAFAPELCANHPPIVTQQPSSRNACAGSSTAFTVAATGTGTLTYQWQKNSANLSNAGHYSGVTTATMTISDVSAADAGSYRCVLSDSNGSTNSNSALLTVTTCTVGCLQNPDFEAGFASGAGNGWAKFIKSGGEGSNLAFSDETAEKHAGAHCQEIYSHDIGYDGGVYQQFATTPGQSYTVKGWIKVYSPQGSNIAEGFLGVDPAGGTDPNSPSILWASKPWDYWSQDAFTVTAQGNFVTVYLRGRSTKPASGNKVAYVWIDDIQLSPGPPIDAVPEALSPTSIEWRWTDLLIETGYRVRDAGGADKSGLLAADTAQWTETTGISPNTAYTRGIHAISACGESDPSAGRTAYALSIPPAADSITPSNSYPALNESVVWTAVGGFGPGTLQYYRYAWDASPTHTWTGSETQWSAGTISTVPTAPGLWYLHVQGYNGDNLPNGTHDYVVTVPGIAIPPDLDHDGDVDQADFDLFIPCLTGAVLPLISGCNICDFDHDADVDQSDFGIFQRCFSGVDIPADPNCAI